MPLALLIAAQAIAVPAVPLPAARFSHAPPQRIILTNCPEGTDGEIVVCAAPDKPRLPLPDERGPPDRPIPSNPDLSTTIAQTGGGPDCASLQGGCQVGVDVFGAGTAAIRLIGKLFDPGSCCERPGESTDPGMLIGDAIGGLKRAFGKKPDKSGRVAISLDDPPPVSAKGRLLP
jgi:hypothetical protein